MNRDHIFVISAYGENPYLEDCVISLVNQLRKSLIVIATSTPNAYIDRIAAKYSIEVVVNEKRIGICEDWNFCLSVKPEFKYVTIAHQDDIYFREYSEHVLKSLRNTDDALICFTNFLELKDEKFSRFKLYKIVKSILLLPFFVATRIKSKSLKKISLSFGNPISCSSVTFNRCMTEGFKFSDAYEINLDWVAWLTLANTPGYFCFIRSSLMAHRLSPENETAKSIRDYRRHKEDLAVFNMLWPSWFSRCLYAVYRYSYRKEAY